MLINTIMDMIFFLINQLGSISCYYKVTKKLAIKGTGVSSNSKQNA